MISLQLGGSGLRFLAGCHVEAILSIYSLPVCFFPHVDFLQQDDLLHPSRKEEKVSWQDECTPHCVHPITFAIFYLAGNKHPTLKGRESHGCEHQALEATLRIWHNNLTLTEKILLLEIKDSYSCPHSKACFLLDLTKTLLDQTLLRFL